MYIDHVTVWFQVRTVLQQLALYRILRSSKLNVEYQNRGGRETLYYAILIAKYKGGGCNNGGVECQELY